jgi:hypothetical protein
MILIFSNPYFLRLSNNFLVKNTLIICKLTHMFFLTCFTINFSYFFV